MLVPDLVALFLAWNERHRAPATVRFYKQRLQLFREKFSGRRFVPWHTTDAPDGIRPLDIDAYLHDAGEGQSDSTRRHNAVALESLQSFALREAKALAAPLFAPSRSPAWASGNGSRRPRSWSSCGRAPRAFLLIFDALCQTGCRPGELCRLTVADVAGEGDKCFKRVIELAEHKTARKTGKPRRIPIGEKFAELLRQAIGRRTFGPVFRNARGRAWTPDGLSAVFRRRRDKLRLPREWSSIPHAIASARHSRPGGLTSKRLPT